MDINEFNQWLIDLDHADALVEYAERERDELLERWREASIPMWNAYYEMKNAK